MCILRIPPWLPLVACGFLHLTSALPRTNHPEANTKFVLMLKLFPKITNLPGTNSRFQTKHCSRTDCTDFTTIQLLFGLCSKLFRSLYQEGLCFTWEVGLLLSHGWTQWQISFFTVAARKLRARYMARPLHLVAHFSCTYLHDVVLFSYLYFSCGHFFILFYL